jgi:hypothetical protein
MDFRTEMPRAISPWMPKQNSSVIVLPWRRSQCAVDHGMVWYGMVWFYADTRIASGFVVEPTFLQDFFLVRANPCQSWEQTIQRWSNPIQYGVDCCWDLRIGSLLPGSWHTRIRQHCTGSLPPTLRRRLFHWTKSSRQWSSSMDGCL